MSQSIDAIYEQGVLRPLEPVALSESQRVKITISDTVGTQSSQDQNLFMDRIRAEAAALKVVPTIEEVRAALASIPGSMAQAVAADRGDY